eukprot:437338_1
MNMDRIESVNILNIDNENSTISPMKLVSNKDINNKSYIVSDVDQELLILISFKDETDLKSFTIHAVCENKESCTQDEDDLKSPPKEIDIYHTKNVNLNFEDIYAMKSAADKSVCCKIRQLAKGQTIKLQKHSKNAIKFKKTKYFVIYIKSNQNNTEKTYLNAINFKFKSINIDHQKETIDQPATNLGYKQNLNQMLDEIYDKHAESLNSKQHQNVNYKSSVSYVPLITNPNNNVLKNTQVTQLQCDNKDLGKGSHPRLVRFQSMMNKYHQYVFNNKTTIDELMKYCFIILDDYFHLISDHNDNESFKFIYNRLTKCDVTNCIIFSRHYRNRNKEGNVQEMYGMLDEREIISVQLMDKVHCYYLHSYDMGRKVEIKDDIKDDIKNENHEIKDEFMEGVLMNSKLQTLNRIVNEKAKNVKSVKSINKGIKSKYNTNYDTKTNTTNDYHYGHLFKYNYEGEQQQRMRYRVTVVEIAPKYVSLKEELIQNKIAILTDQQFKHEYSKATMMFNSYFRQKNYNLIKDSSQRLWIFKLPYLLSLMIYCNYTELSCKFSKTYRENHGKNHKNFYWMGRFIKTVVQKFGSKSRSFPFYHGVGSKLLFPRCFWSEDETGWIFSIFGPLSTSSVFEVAVNFANSQGLIVQLEGGPFMPNCFPCSWLSDFTNESEYLFIQSGDNVSLEVINIFQPEYGYEYEIILKCLRRLNNVLCGFYSCRDIDDSGDNVRRLMVAIIENQLSFRLKRFKRLTSFSEYAVDIIQSYFGSFNRIFFRRNEISHFQVEDTSYIFDIFQINRFEFIELRQILALYTNLEMLELFGVNINESLLKYFYEYFCDWKTRKEFKSPMIIQIWNQAQNMNGLEETLLMYETIFYSTEYSISYTVESEYYEDDTRYAEVKVELTRHVFDVSPEQWQTTIKDLLH